LNDHGTQVDTNNYNHTHTLTKHATATLVYHMELLATDVVTNLLNSMPGLNYTSSYTSGVSQKNELAHVCFHNTSQKHLLNKQHQNLPVNEADAISLDIYHIFQTHAKNHPKSRTFVTEILDPLNEQKGTSTFRAW